MRYYGISAYAGMHKLFPVERFMSQFPKNIKHPCTAFLCGCFGWKTELIEAFCMQFGDRPHAIEFHISNGASRRGGRLGPGAYAQSYSVKDFNEAWEAGGNTELLLQLTAFIDQIKTAVTLYTNAFTTVVICPELEDNMTDRAFKLFARAISEMVGFSLVRCPCTGGSARPQIVSYKEVHGLTAPGTGQIGNLDGVSIDFNDSDSYYKDCSVASAKKYLARSRGFMTLLWSANQQGLGGQSTPTTPAPPHKKRTFIVTNEAISGMKELLNDY